MPSWIVLPTIMVLDNNEAFTDLIIYNFRYLFKSSVICFRCRLFTMYNYQSIREAATKRASTSGQATEKGGGSKDQATKEKLLF